MSGIAKILVVFNLVLAVVVLGMTSSHLGVKETWRGRHDNVKKSLEEQVALLNEQLKQARGNYNNQKSETQNLIAEVQGLKSSLSAKETQMSDLKASHNELKGSFDRLSKTADDLKETINTLTADKDRMTQEKEAALAEKRQAVDAMNDAVTEQRRLEAENQDKLDQLAEAAKRAMAVDDKLESTELVVAQYEKLYGPLSEAVIVPLITAKISAVSDKHNIVLLSVGRDDGVKVGTKFTVYRGNDYIGTVVIDNVSSDHSSGYSEKGVEQGAIQIGDDATTRF